MAAPQLRLEVSLNLAGFRTEVQKLTNIAQSEFTPKINVKFNRQTLDTELNNLQAAIKRRVYRVEIGGNIDTLPDKIKTLKEQLSSLESFKIDLGIGAVKSLSKKDASKINSDIRAQVLGEQKKIYVPVSIKPSVVKKDVLDFKNAVQSKLSGITVKVKADLQAASISGGAKSRSDIDADVRRGFEMISEIGAQRMARGTGGVTEAARREQLRQSLASGGFDVGGLKDIGKQLGVAGVGRFKNVNNLIEKIVAEASIEMVKKYLDPQAVMRNPDRSGLGKVLDTFARGVFNMLGMDPASIRAQQAERRRIPSINWQATVAPSQSPSIGPSSTGRALPPAWRGLPGSSFASQKLLTGDLLTPSMKGVIRDAANDFVDGIRQRMNDAIRQVNVEDLGRVGQRAISGSRVAGYFPPVARFGEGRTPSPYGTGRLGREGETRAELFARREREARMRSALRGVDIMGEGGMTGRAASPYSRAYRAARPQSAIIPYTAGGAIVPSGGGGNIPPTPPRGSGGGGGFFGGMQFNMPQLPGAGLVREIGEEFGFAAKQVLLYGTAYKALGLLQAFPSQVGEAVGALQSFRNTLNAISPTAQEAAASSEFILNIVDKYNVPLQSARDGFTKLYASMAPTGFSGNEIRDLFTGISQAAATFGMSADKVDRVTYAFAQMASKGQVMSEELKGQLGDVLPGAMGIFAKAAGFEGADAIQKFGKALEDGAYKGKPMRDLLKNVTIELKKEFGPGAEGAARTYQGVMTRMANSTKLLYESFEPVAINFLNSIVVPITGGLKTVTDGFKAFFTGQAAQTTGGGAFAKQLEALRPAFEGIRSNITSLVPIFQSFGKILLATGQVFLQIAGNPFVGYLARVYLNVVALTTVVNILNLRALVPFIANLARSIYSVVAFGVQCTLAGQKAVFFDLMVRTLGTTLRTFFAATAVGIILVGIGLIAEAFVTAGARADAARQKMSQFADSVKQLGAVGDVAGATAEKVGQQSLAARLQSAKTLLQQVKSEGRKLTKDQVQELKNLQLTNNLDFLEVGRGPEKGLFVAQGKITNLLGTQSALQAEIESAGRGYLETQTKIVQATKAVTAAQLVQKKQGEESKTEESKTIDITGGKDPKKTSLESYYSLQDTLAKNAADFAAAQTEEEFRHKIELLEMYYDIQETRANAYQRDAIKFEREMVMIEARRQEARLKAQLDVQRAQTSVAGGVTGGLSTTGATGLLQGSTGVSGGPHFHISRADGSPISEQQARALLDPAVRSQVTKTSDYGPRRAPVPGASTFHRGVDLAGRANTPLNLAPGYSMVGQGEAGGLGYAASIRGPQGEMYKVGHLQRPAAGAGAPRKVPGSEKRDAVAEQKTLQASIAKTATERMADAKAVQEQIVALEKYRASAFPTIEQETQNKLLAKRNELFKSGMTDERIDQEIKLYENQQRGAAGLAAVNRLQAKKIINDAQAAVLTKELNQDIANQNNLLQQNATLIGQAKFDQAIKGIRNQIDMARALTPEQEMRTQIAQEGFTGAEAESIFQERKTLQGAEKLKADMQGIAGAIGDSFGNAFKGVITGSMTAQEALAGFFQSVADSFADMVAKMIAEYLKMALIKGIMSIIGKIPGGLGGGGENLGPNSSAVFGLDNPDITKYSLPLEAAANGAVWTGGFQAFANGGIVTGPTLGLVGEGRYNEAVIPLPDGKSVPVQLSGGDGGSQISSNIVVNVNNGQAQSNATGSNSSELGRKIEGAVKQVIVGELRPGGLLASR